MCYDLSKEIEDGIYNEDLQTFEQELLELDFSTSSNNE